MSDSNNKFRKPPRGVSQTRGNVLMAAIAAALASYAGYGVWRDDFSMTIHTSYHKKIADLHFHGISAWVMAAAFFSLALALVILIIKQPFTPQGRKVDMRLANAIGWIAGGVLVLMMILNGLGVI